MPPVEPTMTTARGTGPPVTSVIVATIRATTIVRATRTGQAARTGQAGAGPLQLASAGNGSTDRRPRSPRAWSTATRSTDRW